MPGGTDEWSSSSGSINTSCTAQSPTSSPGSELPRRLQPLEYIRETSINHYREILNILGSLPPPPEEPEVDGANNV